MLGKRTPGGDMGGSRKGDAMKMWTAPNGAQFDLDNPAGCAAAYYLCAVLQNTPCEQCRPPLVPSRVLLREAACGDGPFQATVAESGEHDCSSNRWGAVSVKATNGTMLGLRLHEFEPIAWRENKVTK